MRKTHVLLLVLLAVSLVVPAARAGTADDEWEFELAPFYFWGASISGDTAIGPVDTPLDVSIGNIIDNLQAIFTVHFEARKNAWGGLLDVTYMDIGNTVTDPTGGQSGLDVKSTMVELGGYYRVADSIHAVDILLGARYTDMETSVTLPVHSGYVDESWWDPFVGGRWLWNFHEKWTLNTRFDYGGFGVGCDYTWNAAMIFVWQPWDHAAILAGYRALEQSYKDGDGLDRYVWDATLHGPVLGIDFRW